MPDIVISQLNIKYSMKIPDSASEIKAAESMSIDGVRRFILKFQIDKNRFNEFVSSLNQKGEIVFEEYSKTLDHRDMGFSPIPKWFLTPIQKGVHVSSPSARIIVDKMKSDIYAIYVYGYYSSID